MPRCSPCNRSFGSDEALRQHERDSPAHGRRSGAPAPVKTPTFFVFPQLHQAVVDEAYELDAAPAFTENDTGAFKRKTSTFVMAAFTCKAHGPRPATWSSKKVSIVIKLHLDGRYSAVVYNQRCMLCDGLGTMKLDETSYVQRVAYRLKKWAGIPMDRLVYQKKKTPPHRKDLCEGCKLGVCMENMWKDQEDF